MKLAEACYVASRRLTVGGKMPPPDVIKADQVGFAMSSSVFVYNSSVCPLCAGGDLAKEYSAV